MHQSITGIQVRKVQIAYLQLDTQVIGANYVTNTRREPIMIEKLCCYKYDNNNSNNKYHHHQNSRRGWKRNLFHLFLKIQSKTSRAIQWTTKTDHIWHKVEQDEYENEHIESFLHIYIHQIR